MVLEVVPSAAPLGAEIRGLNLAEEIDGATVAALRDALNRHSVIVMRGQSLTVPRLRRFAGRFGPPEVRGRHTAPGYDDVVVVSNILAEDGKPIGLIDAGRIWHTDSHFEAKPSMYSMLHAWEIPQDEDGNPLGSTWFASTARAYDRLPEAMKQRLATLRAEHSIAHVTNMLLAKGLATKRAPVTPDKDRIAVHPVIRTHPFSGRKCIYVSEGHTSHILDMDIEEGRALIAELQQHIIGDADEIYRHRWAEGDLVMWDNCSAQHYAIGDYSLPKRRLLYRISVAGEATY